MRSLIKKFAIFMVLMFCLNCTLVGSAAELPGEVYSAPSDKQNDGSLPEENAPTEKNDGESRGRNAVFVVMAAAAVSTVAIVLMPKRRL